MKRLKNSARYLLDNGLIFEINRTVLHPLGLAMTIEIDPDNSRWIKIGELVSVDDEDDEGFLFDEETYKLGLRRFNLFLLKEGQKKLDSRLNKLGFLIQDESYFEKEEKYYEDSK